VVFQSGFRCPMSRWWKVECGVWRMKREEMGRITMGEVVESDSWWTMRWVVKFTFPLGSALACVPPSQYYSAAQ
jgi:hypothetical protein